MARRPGPEDGAANGAGTQAIVRSLTVLELFGAHRRELGISEIADSLRLSLSTTHRIVRALTERGYLMQNRTTERYLLGRAAVLLGYAASQGLGFETAQPVLDRVRTETGESVNLGVREGNEMVVMLRAESRQPLRFSQDPGSRLPVHATSMGKAVLAFSAEPGPVVEALPDPLRALTNRTIVDRRRLWEELGRIRRQGYSVDDEEAIRGVRCVAAPILSPSGAPVAAVAVQGPSVRISRRYLQSLAAPIVDVAAEIRDLLPLAQYG